MVTEEASASCSHEQEEIFLKLRQSHVLRKQLFLVRAIAVQIPTRPHFFEKLLVCGMHYQFLSNLPLVFRRLNYV